MSIEFISPFIIKDNPYQGRLIFDRASITELAEDILNHREALPDMMGLIQVPVGRRLANGDVELSVGHRRREAFKLLFERYGDEWGKMPVDLQDLSEEEMAKTAWSENEEREDLTAIEKVMGIERIQAKFGLGLKGVATFLGANLPTLSNLMRLRQLPENVQKMVLMRELAEKTARALLNLIQIAKNEQAAIELAIRARDEDLSATAVEKEVEQWMPHLTRVIDDRIGSIVFEKVPEGCTPTCIECPFRSKYRGNFVCARPEQYLQKKQMWYESEIPVLSTAEIEALQEPSALSLAPVSEVRPDDSGRVRIENDRSSPVATASVSPDDSSQPLCPRFNCGGRIAALNRTEESSHYMCLKCGAVWPSLEELMKEVNGVSTVSDEIQAKIEEILARLSPEQANKVRTIIGENIECLVHIPELIFGSSSVFIQAGERASREELFCALTLSRALNGQFPVD